MDYKIVTGIVQSIINTVQNTAVSSVLALKKHTYKAEIQNFPKFPEEIKVNNQVSTKKTESKLEQVRLILSHWKFPKEIAVSNFPKFPKFPEFPKQISISNFPKFPEFPKEMKVTNPTKMDSVVEGLEDVVESIKALKLDPKINIEAPKPERVIVPPANVTLNEKEIDYVKLAKAIAKELPQPDYDRIATTIAEEFTGRIVSTGGGSGGGLPFKGKEGDPTRALVDAERRLMTVQEDRWGLNDTSKTGNTTYTGEEDVDGNWIVRKIVKSGKDLAMTYATVKNNIDTTNYTDAWDNKEDLEYSSYKIAFS